MRFALSLCLLVAPFAVAEEPADPPPGPDPYVPLGQREVLGQADIMEVVLAHKDQLGDCVTKHQKAQPGVHGKLIIRWSIRTTGETFDVQVVTPEVAKTTMAQCTTEVITRLRFPKHKKQGEPTTFPFKF